MDGHFKRVRRLEDPAEDEQLLRHRQGLQRDRVHHGRGGAGPICAAQQSQVTKYRKKTHMLFLVSYQDDERNPEIGCKKLTKEDKYKVHSEL